MNVIGIRFSIITYFSKNANINVIYKCFSTSRTYLNNDESSVNVVIDSAASKKFIDGNIQKLLKQLTGLNLDKVFRARALGQRQSPPVYKFMTTEQIQEAAKSAMKKANQQLQMPPLVPIKEDVAEVLQDEPKLIGFDNAKYIFTDITYGVKEKDRIIVVREPSGVLRKAFNSERHRMNQIYFPRFGRTLRHPKMFQQKYLELLWEKGEFEFILDRACIQFEPDDRQYHDITLNTYCRLNEQMAFDKLRSTRHYGPLCFYLALTKNIDNLLLENLRDDRVDDAVAAIQLYNLVNSDASSASLVLDPDNRLQYIKEFIQLESKIPEKLELVLQSVVDIPETKSQASG